MKNLTLSSSFLLCFSAKNVRQPKNFTILSLFWCTASPRGCLFSNIVHGLNSQRISTRLSSCPLLASVVVVPGFVGRTMQKKGCISSRYGKMLFDLFKSNLMHLGYCLPNLISSSLNIKGKEGMGVRFFTCFC